MEANQIIRGPLYPHLQVSFPLGGVSFQPSPDVLAMCRTSISLRSADQVTELQISSLPIRISDNSQSDNTKIIPKCLKQRKSSVHPVEFKSKFLPLWPLTIPHLQALDLSSSPQHPPVAETQIVCPLLYQVEETEKAIFSLSRPCLPPDPHTSDLITKTFLRLCLHHVSTIHIIIGRSLAPFHLDQELLP
jgi:hypothetical protein